MAQGAVSRDLVLFAAARTRAGARVAGGLVYVRVAYVRVRVLAAARARAGNVNHGDEKAGLAHASVFLNMPHIFRRADR